MKLTIKKFSILTGVSVRTLQYYDKIGLLTPDYVDKKTRYRYYSNNNYLRIQEILFYKELDFSLKDILSIISNPSYNKIETLTKQKELLLIKRMKLDNIINNIECLEKGENINMNEYNNKYEENKLRYKNEVLERWGNTDIYIEHNSKTKNYSKNKWNEIEIKMNEIFKKFNILLNNNIEVNNKLVLNEVKRLKDLITETQYTCTNEILLSLGNMYVHDERFRNNIDKVGIGTASYINKAIIEFCHER